MRKTIASFLSAAVLMTSVATMPASAAVTLAGDVDCNEIVNINDVILLSRFVAEDKIILSEQGVANADVDSDGRLTVNDVNGQLNKIAGLPPVEKPVPDTVPVTLVYQPPTDAERAAYFAQYGLDDIVEISKLTRVEYQWGANSAVQTIDLNLDVRNAKQPVEICHLDLPISALSDMERDAELLEDGTASRTWRASYFQYFNYTLYGNMELNANGRRQGYDAQEFADALANRGLIQSEWTLGLLKEDWSGTLHTLGDHFEFVTNCFDMARMDYDWIDAVARTKPISWLRLNLSGGTLSKKPSTEIVSVKKMVVTDCTDPDSVGQEVDLYPFWQNGAFVDGCCAMLRISSDAVEWEEELDEDIIAGMYHMNVAFYGDVNKLNPDGSITLLENVLVEEVEFDTFNYLMDEEDKIYVLQNCFDLVDGKWDNNTDGVDAYIPDMEPIVVPDTIYGEFQ